MSIPLNIDWQQILLHLLNFTILAFGLYMLLYKPVKNFMDKRTEYYKDMDNEAQEKLNNAAAVEDSAKERINNIETEIANMKSRAAQESAAQTEAELKSAREQADKIIADAKVTANAEKERIISSAGREITELAAAAADKLLKEALKDEQ